MRKILVCLFAVMTLCGCMQDSDKVYYEYFDFGSADSIIIESWADKLFIRDYNTNLLSWKNYLIIANMDKGKYVHLYDKKTRKLIKSGIIQGKEAHNLVSGVTAAYVSKEGKLYIIDVESSLLITDLNLLLNDSILCKKVAINQCAPYNFKPYNIAAINEDLILLGVTDDKKFDDRPGRLNVVDINTKSTKSTSRYLPLVEWTDTANYNLVQGMYALNGELKISPDKKKFVYTEESSAILEIYSLSSDFTILSDTVRYYSERVDITDFNAVFKGFRCVDVTDDYIIAVIKDPGNENRVSGYYIGVFNWDGDLKNLYKTSLDIRNICADEDGKTMYLLVLNPDITYTIHQLKL